MADFVGPDASMPILRSRVHGEQADRFQLLGDGTILKGDGSGSLSVERVYVNVAQGPYNARGDGTTDDTGAIQAALNALATSGGVAFFPAGLYLISSTLTLPYGVSMEGYGGHFEEGLNTEKLRSTIKLAAGANCDMLVNDPAAPVRPGQSGTNRWQRSRIRGLSWQGSRTAQTVNDRAIMRFTKAWSITLDHCALVDSCGYCLYLDTCNEINSSHSTYELANRSPVYFRNTQDCVWTGTNAGGAFESSLVLDGSFGNSLHGLFHNALPRNTTLASGIGSSDTSLSVASGASFPVGIQFTVQIDSEQITVTRSGNTFNVVARGANSTTAASHSSGARVQQVVSHAHGVYLCNVSNGNSITGRSDQNYQQSLYVEAGSNGNTIDLAYQAPGWGNATPQDAVYLDGSYNIIQGPATSYTGGNPDYGVGWGPNATRNVCSVLPDTTFTGAFTGRGTAIHVQNNILVEGLSRTIFVGSGGLTSAGRVVLNDATGNGSLDMRQQTSAPATPPSNRTVIWTRSTDGHPAYKLSDGIERPLGLSSGSIFIDVLGPAVDSVGTWGFSVLTTAMFNGYKSNAGAQNDYLAWDVYFDAGTYTVQAMGRSGGNRGILSVQFDDVEKSALDFYAASTVDNAIVTASGIVVATPGVKRVKAKAANKNASSSGYGLFLNALGFVRTA